MAQKDVVRIVYNKERGMVRIVEGTQITVIKLDEDAAVKKAAETFLKAVYQ